MSSNSRKPPNDPKRPPIDPKKPVDIRRPGDANKATEPKKSILVIPSRIVTRTDEVEGGEETEIAAQISVPQEGGWGWVVVIACFWALFVLDGVAFTFGSLFEDMTKDLKVEDSLVAFVNSLAVALYLLLGPLASALVNRFGFRLVMMSGSITVCCGLICSYFATSYAMVCFTYGAIAGFGYCLINLSSALIVGFYFEKLRSVAITIAATGSSIGIMAMNPINVYLVKLTDWRTTTLLHAGLFGTLYFTGMTYRPVLSLTVVTNVDDPTRTVTYLPNLSTTKGGQSRTRVEGPLPTTAERLFSAVSNVNFPTAASIVEEGLTSAGSSQPGPSKQAVSRLTLKPNTPQGTMSKRQLKQVQSYISRTSVQDKSKKNVEVDVETTEQKKKRSCWARLCHWEEHVQEARPMYRDDVFYEGNVEKLAIYQKSMMDTNAENRTGLEYQLAVSRAITTGDLKERRGIFTTAARRVLATMMDPQLLARPSFLLMCSSGCMTFMGFLVPYVYIQGRNLIAGLPESHCSLFVTVIGFSNAIGRLALGFLAVKVDPLKIYAFACCASGISTILSDISYNLYYQYGYCVVFGGFIASLSCLRSIIFVNLYGLDKLTNATGMMLLFQGFGSLVSTPMAGIIKNYYGFSVAFYVAGIFMLTSGILTMPVKCLSTREDERSKKPGTQGAQQAKPNKK